MTNQSFLRVPLKNILNISRIITIHCYDLAPTYFNQGEAHDFWEIVYVDRGEIRLRAGENERTLRKGEIVFHRPNEFHSIACDGEHSASVFIITFDCHSAAMKYFCGKVARVPKELSSLMQRLIEESARNFHVSQYPLLQVENAPIGGQQLIRIYLEELLIRMMRCEEQERPSGILFTSRESMENTLAQQIGNYLLQNVYGHVTLEELSERFHFGKSHLCDVFKKSTGETIVQYFSGLKIAEAKRLLRRGELTVSKISETLGYESPAYFSRVFHRHTGMSPRAFRDALIGDGRVYLERETPLV